jgi:glycosyltransferase involved in cell wall biosynthesis
MKKIILVSNTSWYLYNFRLGVIRLLQQQNFQIVCIANYDEYTQKLIEEGVTFIKSSVANKGINPFQDLNYLWFLVKHYRKIKPCFIFHYTIKPNIYGSLAARLINLKSIAIVSGAGYVFLRKNILNWITRKLYRLAAKASTEMWFVNKEDLLMFTEEGIVNSKRTKVLPGEGIDTEIFKRDSPYPSNKKNFVFLLAGRMLWDKGVGIYVEAAKLIKQKHANTRFQLLGFVDTLNPSAITKEQIRNWEKDGIIEYLGSTDDIKKFLNAIDCFVLPSYYREGVPKSLLEAASLEIPIITTNNVGCREVVKDGYNGFLCSIKDSKSLAEKMEKIVTMEKSFLQEMGSNGRKKIITEFHERLVLKYYEEILNGDLKK